MRSALVEESPELLLLAEFRVQEMRALAAMWQLYVLRAEVLQIRQLALAEEQKEGEA